MNNINLGLRNLFTMIIASAPFMNMVLSFLYRIYSMLPYVTPILTIDQLCESEQQITPPLYCKYVLIHAIVRIEAEIIHEEPYLVLFHKLVNKVDSNRVINLIKPYEYMAGIGGLGQHSRTDNTIRNSSTGSLQEPANTKCIVERWYPALSFLSGLKVKEPSGEPMAITHYDTGGFYKTHYDSENDTPDLLRRLGTFLLYLNGDYQGGNTIFPHMQLAITPQQGDGLIFYSHLANSRLDEKTLHMGCPIREGEKWIGSLWIRNITQQGPAATCYGDELYVRPGFLRSSF